MLLYMQREAADATLAVHCCCTELCTQSKYQAQLLQAAALQCLHMHRLALNPASVHPPCKATSLP